MKSSTIRRAALSRESMEVIESLSKNRDENTPGEYYRPEDAAQSVDTNNNSQEIDLLWQTFKSVPAINTDSPLMMFVTGLITGIALTLVIPACFNHFGNGSSVENTAKTRLFGIEKIFSGKSDPIKVSEEKIGGVMIPEDDEVSEPVSSTAVDSANSETATASTGKTQKYVVKDGDTGESIIRRFYGSYSPERAERIIKLNNLSSLDRLSIDQELLLPVEE